MFKVTSRWPHQNSIKIEWNLGKRCNYDCSYCPSEIHDNTSTHTNIEILKATVDKLLTLGKPVRISFTGGEPCVHPKFEELVKYCKHVGISWISVTTNGTRPYEFYANLPVDQLLFSLHLEYDWMRVYNTMGKIADMTTIKIIAQIMCHHDHMNSAYTLFARCLTDKIPATLRRIRWTEGDHDLFDDMRYHPDDLLWIKKQEATVQTNTLLFYKDKPMEQLHSNDVIKLHLNQYKGWTCNAGIESLMINWDGEVHRATCRVGSGLGNIYNGNFIVPTEPVVCDRNFCTCAADIPLTKINLATQETFSVALAEN
jgi:MoaA/NifB/PqqE/SkfB family radical SAM enzyme